MGGGACLEMELQNGHQSIPSPGPYSRLLLPGLCNWGPSPGNHQQGQCQHPDCRDDKAGCWLSVSVELCVCDVYMWCLCVQYRCMGDVHVCMVFMFSV